MWIKVAGGTIALLIVGYVISLFWTPADIWSVLRHAHHWMLASMIILKVGKFVLIGSAALIGGGVWLWQRRSQRQTAA